MTVMEIAEQIASWPLSTAVRTGLSWRWLFPTIESVHVISIATVFGSIFLLDLRLIGIGEAGTRVSRYSAELLPLTWIAFVMAVISGALMFIAKAPDYVANLQFQLKMGFVLLAGLNMAFFQWGPYRRVHEWDRQSPPPSAARIAGLASIACWITVIFLGRWIGFSI